MLVRMQTTFILAILFNASVDAGGPQDVKPLTDEEAALLNWSKQFQQRALALCEQASVPSRREGEDRMSAALQQAAAEQQAHLETSMATLGDFTGYAQDPRIVIGGWGPTLEREVTRRQSQLLRDWREAERKHSPERVLRESTRRDQTLERHINTWRREMLRRETRLARMERINQERLVARLAKQYAVNWLLGGHPEVYVPIEWTQQARRSRPVVSGPPLANTCSAPSLEEFKSVRASLRHLTEVLVAVGVGDFEPSYLLQAERQLLERRSQAQTLMAVLTGRQLDGNDARMACRQSSATDRADNTDRFGGR